MPPLMRTQSPTYDRPHNAGANQKKARIPLHKLAFRYTNCNITASKEHSKMDVGGYAPPR